MEYLTPNQYLAKTIKYLIPKLDDAEAKVEQKIVKYRGNIEF